MLISYIIRCTWEFRNSGNYGNSGKRCGCIATPPVEFRNSGNYGNSVKRCGCVATPPVEFRNSGNYGKRCGCVATPPVEFGNSGNYRNSGKRCYITGPSGIPEFRELWEFWEEMRLCRYTPCGIPEFWEEMLYHWAIWNSGNSGNYGNSGKRCYITGPSGIPE